MRVAVALPVIDAQELPKCATDRLVVRPAAVGVLREDDPFDPAAVDRRAVICEKQEGHPFIEDIARTWFP